MVRIDANTGQLDEGWKYPPGKTGAGAIYGSPLVRDGVVYDAGYSCRGNVCAAEVFALDAGTGNPVWSEGGYKVASKVVGRAAFGAGVLVFGTAQVGQQDETPGYLYALDPAQDAGKQLQDRVQGRLKWRVAVDGVVFSGPAVADGVAYFGTMGRTLYAVDLKDDARYRDNPSARILWEFKADGAITSSPLVHDGKVFFGDFQDRFYALNFEARRQGHQGAVNAANGEWSFNSEGWFWAQPVTEGDVVYAATLSGRVYALDEKTGQQKWTEPAVINGLVVAAPAFVDSQRGRALAVPSGEKDIVIVRLDDGSIQGSLFTNGPVMSSPSVVGDFVFVHAEKGEFYTFSSKSFERRSCVITRGKEAGGRCA